VLRRRYGEAAIEVIPPIQRLRIMLLPGHARIESVRRVVDAVRFSGRV
jgi:hypothetical protein